MTNVLGEQFNKKTPPGLTPEGIAEHHKQSDAMDMLLEHRTARQEDRGDLDADDER